MVSFTWSSILDCYFSLTRVLPLERCDSQVLADLLLQHVVLSCVVWGPLVLCQVLCREVCQAGREAKGQQRP